MARTVNVYEAKAKLSELIRAARTGEEVIIARHGAPLVRLEPVEPLPPRPSGFDRGLVWIADDFDELPEELLRLFEGDEA